jgi:hypothetical protein
MKAICSSISPKRNTSLGCVFANNLVKVYALCWHKAMLTARYRLPRGELRDFRSLTAMRDHGDSDATETPRAAAQYILTFTEELAQLARRHSLDSLGYILDMARLEADQIANGSRPDGRER